MHVEKSFSSTELDKSRNETSKVASERNYFINELLVDLGTNTLYKLKANFDKCGGQVNLVQV